MVISREDSIRLFQSLGAVHDCPSVYMSLIDVSVTCDEHYDWSVDTTHTGGRIR